MDKAGRSRHFAAMQQISSEARRERRIGLLCAGAVLVAWTGFLLSGRLSVRQSFTVWDMTALRLAGSLLLLLPLLLRHGWPRLPWWRGAALAATAGLGYAVPTYAAFAHAPASHAGVMLIGAQPFIAISLAALLFGDRWTPMRLLSLGVVAVGIGLLAADTMGGHPGAWKGDLLFLAGATLWAVFSLLVRLWKVPALTAILAIALYSALPYLPLWWLVLPSRLDGIGTGPILWQIFYQGLVAAVLASFFFTRAVNALGPATTTTITALTPALAALLAWPLLGEALGLAGLLGVSLVSAGSILGVLRPGRLRPARA